MVAASLPLILQPNWASIVPDQPILRLRVLVSTFLFSASRTTSGFIFEELWMSSVRGLAHFLLGT
jgi:hypothetical protein